MEFNELFDYVCGKADKLNLSIGEYHLGVVATTIAAEEYLLRGFINEHSLDKAIDSSLELVQGVNYVDYRIAMVSTAIGEFLTMKEKWRILCFVNDKIDSDFIAASYCMSNEHNVENVTKKMGTAVFIDQDTISKDKIKLGTISSMKVVSGIPIEIDGHSTMNEVWRKIKETSAAEALDGERFKA